MLQAGDSLSRVVRPTRLLQPWAGGCSFSPPEEMEFFLPPLQEPVGFWLLSSINGGLGVPGELVGCHHVALPWVLLWGRARMDPPIPLLLQDLLLPRSHPQL